MRAWKTGLFTASLGTERLFAMNAESAQVIAAYVALAVPATVAIANIAKVLLEWMQQGHKVREAQIQQSHEITTHYLDKALNPTVPLAIRHQLLRFLATPDSDGTRLNSWAKSELERVGGLVDEANGAVVAAEESLRQAKSATELESAERKLADAVRKQRGLLEPPTTPPITAAAQCVYSHCATPTSHIVKPPAGDAHSLVGPRQHHSFPALCGRAAGEPLILGRRTKASGLRPFMNISPISLSYSL